MPASESNPAVWARDAAISRGSSIVLSEVNVEIPRGSIAAVLGPNGAGKTTLVFSICGFVKPASGSLEVLGRDMTSIGPSELARLRRSIGLLPQLSEINELAPLSVREVVAIGRAGRAGLGARLSRDDWRAVDEAISLFGLDHLASRVFHRLSGGEKRKTGLARVFAQEPELFILDEPMANLDVSWQERLREEIQKAWERTGATVIIVSHDTHNLPEGCSLFALVGRGTVLASGPSSRVLTEEALERSYGKGVSVVRREGRDYLLGA